VLSPRFGYTGFRRSFGGRRSAPRPFGPSPWLRPITLGRYAMSGSFCTVPIVLVAGTAAALPPFTIEPLVMDGDVFEEVGAITAIDSLAVNDRGDWLVEADTDHPNTDADGVMILNGVVVARQGQALAAPAGATLSSFDSASLNKFGDAGWNLFLDGTAGSSDDSGLFFNTTMV